LKVLTLKQHQNLAARSDYLRVFNLYFFEPVRFGLFGFSVAFTLILLVKLFAYLVKYDPGFIVGLKDVGLSLIGFLIVFSVRFLQNLRKSK